MKRRMLVSAGLLVLLLVVLLIVAGLCLPGDPPGQTVGIETGDGRVMYVKVSPPTWWDRAQEQCRNLTGWPPAPPLILRSATKAHSGFKMVSSVPEEDAGKPD